MVGCERAVEELEGLCVGRLKNQIRALYSGTTPRHASSPHTHAVVDRGAQRKWILRAAVDEVEDVRLSTEQPYFSTFHKIIQHEG